MNLTLSRKSNPHPRAHPKNCQYNGRAHRKRVAFIPPLNLHTVGKSWNSFPLFGRFRARSAAENPPATAHIRRRPPFVFREPYQTSEPFPLKRGWEKFKFTQYMWEKLSPESTILFPVSRRCIEWSHFWGIKAFRDRYRFEVDPHYSHRAKHSIGPNIKAKFEAGFDELWPLGCAQTWNEPSRHTSWWIWMRNVTFRRAFE